MHWANHPKQETDGRDYMTISENHKDSSMFCTMQWLIARIQFCKYVFMSWHVLGKLLLHTNWSWQQIIGNKSKNLVANKGKAMQKRNMKLIWYIIQCTEMIEIWHNSRSILHVGTCVTHAILGTTVSSSTMLLVVVAVTVNTNWH
jgi:hypothetical protein